MDSIILIFGGTLYGMTESSSALAKWGPSATIVLLPASARPILRQSEPSNLPRVRRYHARTLHATHDEKHSYVSLQVPNPETERPLAIGPLLMKAESLGLVQSSPAAHTTETQVRQARQSSVSFPFGILPCSFFRVSVIRNLEL